MFGCGVGDIVMTLIAALKYDKGTILATDTRVVFGGIKRDGVAKIVFLSSGVGIAACGLIGATDDIVANVAKCTISPQTSSFDLAASALSDEALKWNKENSEKIDEDEDNYSFLLASASSLRKVFSRGYGEDIPQYDCMGSGSPYGEYILQNYYSGNLDEEKAKELTAYTILETSKVDPSVGDQLQIAVFSTVAPPKLLSAEETEELKLRLAPISRAFVEQQISMVEKIVDMRENINGLWKNKFDFKLFLSHEKAILQMMKPCRTGQEFTNNISAIALILDRINIGEMKKEVPAEIQGSINILGKFLTNKFGTGVSDFTSNFRDILRLRSTTFPIHKADSEFVNAVVKISGEYPPKWSNLYLKALQLFVESLSELLKLLTNPPSDLSTG
jgi:20S proteasome alpha/beta subunit